MIGRKSKKFAVVVTEFDEYGETRFRGNVSDYTCLSCGVRVLPNDKGIHRRYHMNKAHQRDETRERLDDHAEVIDKQADAINDHAGDIERISKWTQIPEAQNLQTISNNA
jgi:hypothetical protein